ncbi:MAG: 5'/3'-nucleotidase SurE, partial [Duncaniella sp.]|nr:5'/3'-nucleotidase SurE [Duncaniella sp.]
MEKRPLILITNDDGIGSKGIIHLARIAATLGDVVVVAPDAAQSGKSSAITANTPLYVNSHSPIADNIRMFSTSGTPVDCVKLAMFAVLDRRPDLLLSGINHGSNAGVNNIYSGTMGAAMEGCTIGIPS